MFVTPIQKGNTLASELALDQAIIEDKPKSALDSSPASGMVLSTAKGSGILAFGKVIETAGRFVLAVLLARALGADQFGQYTLAIATFTMIASVSKLGMDSAVVRYIAIFAGKRDDARVWGVLQITMGFAFIASILCAVGLFYLADPIANSIYREPRLVSLLQLGAVLIPITAMNAMLVGASRGFKRMHFSVIAQDIVNTLFRLVLVGLLFIVGIDAFWALVIYGAADLLGIVILAHLLNGVFPWRRSLKSAHREIGEVLRFSIPLFVSEILKRFRGDIQTIMLGALYAVSSVGVFTVASKINVVSRISSYSLMTSAEPAFAELHSRGDMGQMGSLYRATSRWMFVLNFPVVLMTLLFAKPILSIFGESFVSGAPALILLSIASLINICTGLGGTMIDMTGYTKLKLVNSVTQISLFVITSLLFIPPWGVIGAASAAMVSSSIIQLARMIQVAYLFKMHPYDHWFAKAALAAAAITLAGFFTRWSFDTESSILYAALHGCILGSIYALVMYLFCLAPEDRAIVARTFKRVRTLAFKYKLPLVGNTK